ncbi:guanine nucleotide exchange factor SRM1 isoform X3 [Cinnamomum micranthum f. kanehirae]|uniref:Guanine nucleotide exchange factor SRM1 isoform X3 n=1 Tax=Cinnamomum micranthum f. kanehirae TaxID=337451 RepID=A0A443N4P4_9MAGN|nr:guanine nucleotide exchange factor SRM1 isoform X3 [Cinnamomum micranthum f. kanehirae]
MSAGEFRDSGNTSKKVVGIAAGEAHTLALTGDGSVYSWGRGTFGRLGTGKDSDVLYPVRVKFDSSRKVGVSADRSGRERPKFVGITAGAYHSLALEDDGSVWSWGYNTCILYKIKFPFLGLNGENSLVPCFLERFLELGIAEESNSENRIPLKVSYIKAGGMISLAIDSLGALWMWGNCPKQSDSNGREFSLVSSSTPLPVWDFHGHTVVKVACGNEHVVALVSAGETFTGGDLICYSWGNNNHGQLGLGDNECRSRPEIVKTFDKDCPWSVYEIACGAFHTVALTIRSSNSDDTTEAIECICWTFGLGDNGQLGHGTINSTNLPEAVSGLPRDAFLISADCGLFHTCVVSAAGDVWAWGMEKGLGLCPDASFSGVDAGDALYPLRIPCNEIHGANFSAPVQVTCGAAHTVLVADDGYKLWAWGRGRSGVLGRGNISDSVTPCIAMWPPLDEDFKKNEIETTIDRKGTPKDDESVKVLEMEKRLSLAAEEVQLLQSKLALMERYASILHTCVFGKAMEERDLPPTLRNWGTLNIEREWENMIESADRGKLARMEAFYRNMHEAVKDKLMKRKVEEMIKESLHSLSTGNRVPMENASSLQ